MPVSTINVSPRRFTSTVKVELPTGPTVPAGYTTLKQPNGFPILQPNGTPIYTLLPP